VASGFSLPALWIGEGMASTRSVGVWRVWPPDFGHQRNDLPGHADCTASLVSRHVVGDHPEEWGQRFGIATSTGTETYRTAWTMLHRLRRAMVRPGRDLLTGRVEVDECYIGGVEEGLLGRLNLKKVLVVVAAQEDGPGIGRIRMRQILDASAESLIPFVQDSVVPGSVIHTDGWLGYVPLERKGYKHQITFLRGKKKTPSELMPRVHQVVSLLKRWLIGTHQGAVSHKHLDYYLDEFTFRFNRRRSKSRGKLFFRLAQQAVAIDPVTYYGIVHPGTPKAQSVGVT
jgi:transposase-like protein